MNAYTLGSKIRSAFKIAAMAGIFAANTSNAATTTIDFETRHDGLALHAPTTFENAGPLTNLYSRFGVNFTGGSGTTGGVILDELAAFVLIDASSGTAVGSILRAHSGRNFLAIPRQTEVVLFDTPVTYISAYIGGQTGGAFFDEDWNVIESMPVVRSSIANPWAFFEYSSTSRPIAAVYFNNIDRMDDFTFGDRVAVPAVPLPASLPLLGAAVAGLVALRRRKN